jgi:hypothetical protein
MVNVLVLTYEEDLHTNSQFYLGVFFMKQVFDAIACEAVESPSCGWFNIRQMPHNCGLLFSSYRVTTHLNCLVCPCPSNWSLNSAAPRRGSLIFSAYKWDSNSLISVPKWGSYISCCDEREGGHFISPWSQHSVPNSLRSSPVWCPKLDCQLKTLLTQTLQNVGGVINSTFYLGNLFKSLDNQECTLFFLGVHFTGWGVVNSFMQIDDLLTGSLSQTKCTWSTSFQF